MRTLVIGGLVATLLAGCGGAGSSAPNPGAPENSPPGDIPDNQAFVPFTPAGAGFSVKVPEGWSRTAAAGATTFTDKLNTIRVESRAASGPLTQARAKETELPRLGRSAKVTTVSRRAGTALELTYLAAAPANPVTGKAGQDAVERYVFFHKGRRVVLTLSGPKGADNVDPWRIVTDSLRWTR